MVCVGALALLCLLSALLFYSRDPRSTFPFARTHCRLQALSVMLRVALVCFIEFRPADFEGRAIFGLACAVVLFIYSGPSASRLWSG